VVVPVLVKDGKRCATSSASGGGGGRCTGGSGGGNQSPCSTSSLSSECGDGGGKYYPSAVLPNEQADRGRLRQQMNARSSCAQLQAIGQQQQPHHGLGSPLSANGVTPSNFGHRGSTSKGTLHPGGTSTTGSRPGGSGASVGNHNNGHDGSGGGGASGGRHLSTAEYMGYPPLPSHTTMSDFASRSCLFNGRTW